MTHHEKTFDIIFSRWKSQILYAAVKLDIFEVLTKEPKESEQIAKEIGIDVSLAYRLLRALGSMGFLKEDSLKRFSITDEGQILRNDHPQTLRGIVLLEEGPEHYQIWKHLPSMIKEGKQNAFVLEYGHSAFEYAEANPEYGTIFNQAMSSYSGLHTDWVMEALKEYDFSKIQHLVDIGGGHGHLISHLLSRNPNLKGTVLELESVIKNKEMLWAGKLGVAKRCNYIEGDMFQSVPPGDAYIMKMILHDWNDDECIKILSNIHTACTGVGRIFIVEHLIPSPEIAHFSKLFDIHMMCWGTGRERTVQEYSTLLHKSGWKYVQTFYPSNGIIGIIEGTK